MPNFRPLNQLRWFHGYEAPLAATSTSGTGAGTSTACSPVVPGPLLHCPLPSRRVRTSYCSPWVPVDGPFSGL